MGIKELKEDNRYLKNQNNVLYAKLSKILRFIDAYTLVGKKEVPITSVREILIDGETE